MSSNVGNTTRGTTGAPYQGALSANMLIGDPVVNRKGEKLGKIEDLAIHPQGFCVEYAVLSFGGFLGMGDKRFAVPLEAMELSPDERKFIRERQSALPFLSCGAMLLSWPSFERTRS